MAQSPVTGSVQQHRQDTDETIPLRRPKKEPGAPTGKNVVVLKYNDVKEKDGIVFMPNTIDMAKLKKPQRGQFKTNVQVSSKMTQSDIKQILEEAFPFLKNKRFYCAGAADKRTRLDFYGERRIWDGRLIKQNIKGNSALYIYTDEGSVGTPDSTGSKHLTLKRSHDQMMTIKKKSRIEIAKPSAATDVMAQGSFVAPLGMAQNSISTASYSQTRETVPQTPDRCAATGNDTPPLYPLAHHSGLPGMVPSSLTSKMGRLNVANSSSGWEMDEYAQTAASEKLFTYVPLEAMGKQGQGNGNGIIVGKSKQSSVVNTDEIRARDTSGGVDAIEGPNKDIGTSGSDYESQLSAVEKSTDSGIEASDGLRVNGDIFDTESRQHLPSDASPSSSFSQMFNTVTPFSATEETSSGETADDIPVSLTDLFGTVEGICPESGSVEGGFKFYISFTEALSDEIQYGEAHFERAANVPVQKLNPFTMCGNVPRSPSPGKVTVTVITEAGEDLGFTLFNYIDDKENMLKQLVKDPMLQAKYFGILSTKFANGNLTSNSNIAQAQGQRILEENDFPVQTKQQQSVKFLQLMVYTAAETDAQEFIEMVFSTSAGQVVFNSYKDRTPLPEDVARANGHEELAQYLQDVNTRLSKEAKGDVECCAIDWLELVKAVQEQCSQEESAKQLDEISDSDNTSDYFADVETSSCGSSDHGFGWTEISENKVTPICPTGPLLSQESCIEKGNFNEGHPTSATVGENCPSDKSPEKATNSNNITTADDSTQGLPHNVKDRKGVAYWVIAHALNWMRRRWKKGGTLTKSQSVCLGKEEKELPSKFDALFERESGADGVIGYGASKPNMAKPKESYKHPSHVRILRGPGEAFRFKGFVFILALLTASAGFKLNEGRILHWAVGNGYTYCSKILIQCGVHVDVPGVLQETPLHVAAKNGFWELADVLVQSGGNVNAKNSPKQETPLHLAVRNGHQHITEFLIHRGSHVNAKNAPMQETPLHLASRNGHQQIAEFLIEQGGQVNARNIPGQETPLHVAVKNGHQNIAEFLIKHGSQVDARNVPMQETPLHLASRNGHQKIARFLIQHGGKVNARNVPMQETPLHLASRNGHQKIAKFLIQHGSKVNARNLPMHETPLHLAVENGHQQIAEVLIQHGGDINARNDEEEISLHLAARNGHQELAELLIQQEGVVNARSGPLQETPFHFALEYGHHNIDTEFLIRHGSEVDAGNNAAKNGHKLVEELLIRHGCDLDGREANWRVAFHLAVQNGLKNFVEGYSIIEGGDARSCLTYSSFQGYVSELLTQHVCEVVANVFSKQNTPLHLTAACGKNQISEVLIQHGICINASNDEKKVLFHFAVKNSHGHLAKVLIDRSSVTSVDFTSSNQETPLNLAVRNIQRRTNQQYVYQSVFELEKQYSLFFARVEWSCDDIISISGKKLVKDFPTATRFRMAGSKYFEMSSQQAKNHWQYCSVLWSVLWGWIEEADLSARNQTNNHSLPCQFIKINHQASLFTQYIMDHYVMSSLFNLCYNNSMQFQHLFYLNFTPFLVPMETLPTLPDLVHFDLLDTKACKLLSCYADVLGHIAKVWIFVVVDELVLVLLLVLLLALLNVLVPTRFVYPMSFFKRERMMQHASLLENLAFSYSYRPTKQPAEPERLYPGDKHEKKTAPDVAYTSKRFAPRSGTEMKTIGLEEGDPHKRKTVIKYSRRQSVLMWLQRYHGAPLENEGTPCRSGPGNLDVFPNGESVVGDYTQGLFSALWSNEGNAIMYDQFADAPTKMSLVSTIPIAPLHRIDPLADCLISQELVGIRCPCVIGSLYSRLIGMRVGESEEMDDMLSYKIDELRGLSEIGKCFGMAESVSLAYRQLLREACDAVRKEELRWPPARSLALPPKISQLVPREQWLRFSIIETALEISTEKVLRKEERMVEREKLFARNLLLARELSRKHLSCNMCLSQWERGSRVIYHLVNESVDPDEKERKESILRTTFDASQNLGAAWKKDFERAFLVCSEEINSLDKVHLPLVYKRFEEWLREEMLVAQATYEAPLAGLHQFDMQRECLPKFIPVSLSTRPLKSNTRNMRKTGQVTEEILLKLSCDSDLRKDWKNLGHALRVGKAEINLIDKENQQFFEKCHSLLLLWKLKLDPHATYETLAEGLCHASVQRNDLAEKYCNVIPSMQFDVKS